MIIDYRKASAIASLFRVVDAASGEDLAGLARHLFYADDVSGMYRCYDLNAGGKIFTRNVETGSPLDHVEGLRTDHAIPVFADGTRGGLEEIAWSEYHLPIRIEPRLDLNEFERRIALEVVAGFEEPRRAAAALRRAADDLAKLYKLD